MTFGDDCDTDEDDRDAVLQRRQKAMVVLRSTAMMLLEGKDLPESFDARIGLLFASIAKLAIASCEARRLATEDEGADVDEVDQLMNMMMNDVIACAVCVAERFANAEGTSLPAFSDN